MGVSLITYQLKQECKIELIKQSKILRDSYNDIEIAENTIKKINGILKKYALSSLYFHSSCANDVVMILNRNEYSGYNKTKIGYMAIYGKVENELSDSADSGHHVSYLNTEDIKQITAKIEKYEITNYKGFAKYFKKLPQKVKDSLFGDWVDANMEEIEYFWEDIKETYEFYKDCEKNNSWVYLDFGP